MVSAPSATNRLPDSRDGITITGSGGPTGVAIRQTTVCSCIPPVTDKSIAKRWTEHHRVPQGAFERLELLEGKLSRAVLRGLGGSNPARLPGATFMGQELLSCQGSLASALLATLACAILLVNPLWKSKWQTIGPR